MKSFFLVLLALPLLLSNCTDSDIESDCLKDKKATFMEDNSERGFTFIYTFEQDGQIYTIFDSGIAFDATAEVVDEDCNIVCVYGGFRIAGDQDERCTQYQEGIGRATKVWEGN